MQFDSNKHHRRSLRLKNYDYSNPGAYFVSICVKNRESLFGEVVHGKMELNKYGLIAEYEWLKTVKIRKNVKLDSYIIMPNHLHGIVVITTNSVGAYSHTPLQSCAFRSPSKTIGAIIRGFKSSVTVKINTLRHTHHIPLWQRNYFEHIIRNHDELQRIRKYIAENPMKWETDKENQQGAPIRYNKKKIKICFFSHTKKTLSKKIFLI
jgi:REP element-mobilizing transposase RayT